MSRWTEHVTPKKSPSWMDCFKFHHSHVLAIFGGLLFRSFSYGTASMFGSYLPIRLGSLSTRLGRWFREDHPRGENSTFNMIVIVDR